MTNNRRLPSWHLPSNGHGDMAVSQKLLHQREMGKVGKEKGDKRFKGGREESSKQEIIEEKKWENKTEKEIKTQNNKKDEIKSIRNKRIRMMMKIMSN